ncbi:hypothetical protein GCM10010401_11160 [Rarobacter faecitabidus]|uniref:Copper ion binding protein n=1 Tax=Rarobacter faecitabidus TaxID=13243 RepID=A0A542ZP57_RARFA|nr:copper ion binding protein [Rarobacter faecitabidus]
MTTTTLKVNGMTCGHCVNAVTTELSALDGVSEVKVDLSAGQTSTVTVTSGAALSDDEIAAAIDEAGYSLAEPVKASGPNFISLTSADAEPAGGCGCGGCGCGA